MVPYPVIAGPTAGGKSALAIRLCEALAHRGFHPEIVSADSIQVYRGLDIGSAKPTPEERQRFPHHLIDIVDPTQRFSVADWLTHAEHALDDIHARAAIPVVVGGSLLYVKAFLEGLFQGPDPDPDIRQAIRAMTQSQRREELARIDPAATARIHPNDERRTIRALEVFRQTGKPISELQQQWDANTRTHAILIGLDWPPPELNRRINARVMHMIRAGLVEEARELWNNNRFGPTSKEALGYKQLIEHFERRSTLEDAIERIKIETRRFAKNQRTWLRRLRTTPRSHWINAAATPESHWPTLVLHAISQP